MIDDASPNGTLIATAAAGAAVLSLLLLPYQHRPLPIYRNSAFTIADEASDTYSNLEIAFASSERDLIGQLDRIVGYLMAHKVDLDAEAKDALHSSAWELYL